MKKTFMEDLPSLLGRQVKIAGWVHKVRALGGLVFIILRDCTGLCQVVVKGNPDLVKLARSLNMEDVIEVKGIVQRSRSRQFPVEVVAESISVLNRVIGGVPLDVTGAIEADLGTRLRYRVADLKRPRNLAIFRVQAELVDAFRRYLKERRFIEVHTPKIVVYATEGGAELFEVKYFENIAYLAQSPQIYKQMLVIAGFERVFEIGHAYRAEKHSTVRHLNEYVSLDIEMGFIEDENDLINFEEDLIKYMLQSVEENCSRELKLLGAEVTIPDRIPKLRFPEVKEILVEYYNLKEYEDAEDLDTRGEELITKYVQENYGVDMVFVDLFPLSSRPFYTMPYDEVYGRSFDLIFRGLEVSTGSQRIHQYELLRQMMIKKGLNPDDFKYYLEAFKQGAPPHGGFAIGAERMTMKLLGLCNIREASLFPRDRYRLEP
ncbi:MAG: aspartate--tRNA(Asn) ligase [Thermoprotei archaeon]|nr:MAG: aspartate--tRNA(Asn) ligase [Thermoprotei archaeon]RLF25933.1 MAG: aspartate--tRNA(Asn) ligase [Thermoprotei archaeon]